MCGGGAKSPRRTTERMDTRQQEQQIREYSQQAAESNRLLQEQIQGQLAESDKLTADQQALLQKNRLRSDRLLAQQITGSYRTTNTTGAPQGKGPARSSQVIQRRDRRPLQLTTGDTGLNIGS